MGLAHFVGYFQETQPLGPLILSNFSSQDEEALATYCGYVTLLTPAGFPFTPPGQGGRRVPLDLTGRPAPRRLDLAGAPTLAYTGPQFLTRERME